MQTDAPLIVHDESQVEEKLQKIGLSKLEIVEVAHAAAAAKADALPVDPSGTPGTLSYINGVRTIRLILGQKNWRIVKTGNVEATVNDDLNIQLLFQNVDLACHEHKEPHSISAKGSASRRLITIGQTDLFDDTTQETIETPVHGKNPTVWIVCVSINDTSLCAEVSRPKTFRGNQFEGFHERIFVLNENSDPIIDENNSINDDIDDFDFEISRR